MFFGTRMGRLFEADVRATGSVGEVRREGPKNGLLWSTFALTRVRVSASGYEYKKGV